MNTLAVAVLFVAVAYSSASVIAPAVVSRGALEGALGGQWVPDVPVAAHGYGYAAAAPIVAARAGWAAAPSAVVAPGWTGAVSAKGAIEGALGGQWIPDVPVAHAPVVSAYAAPVVSPYAAHAYAAAPAIAGWHGVDARGALEGALGGQWIPDVAH